MLCKLWLFLIRKKAIKRVSMPVGDIQWVCINLQVGSVVQRLSYLTMSIKWDAQDLHACLFVQRPWMLDVTFLKFSWIGKFYMDFGRNLSGIQKRERWRRDVDESDANIQPKKDIIGKMNYRSASGANLSSEGRLISSFRNLQLRQVQ